MDANTNLTNDDALPGKGMSERRKKRRYPREWQSRTEENEQAKESSTNEQKHPSKDGRIELRATKDQVMKFINAHQSHTPRGLTETVFDQPKFDDVSRYGISETQEGSLWQLETERLISAVESSGGLDPFRFSVNNACNWPADKPHLEHLSSLADETLCNLSICDFDNQILLFEHKKELFNEETYRRAKRMITIRHDPQNPVQPAPESTKSPLLSTAQNRMLYCALIDYATAVAARYACYTNPTEHWHVSALAGLAKCAAKLKFLIIDSERFAHQSLDEAENVLAMDEVRESLGLNLDAFAFDPGNHNKQSPHMTNIERLLKGDEVTVKGYFLEVFLSSLWSMDTVRAIFNDLKGSTLSGFSVDAFDVCSIVYKAGWNDVPTLLCQDRDGEITGRAARSSLRTLYEIYRTIRQVARTIAAEQVNHPQKTAAAEREEIVEPTGAHLILTMQDWEKQGSKDNGVVESTDEVTHLDLPTLADVVSIMVPLLCTQTMTLRYMSWASGFSALFSSTSNSIDFSLLPIVKFTAFASLRTHAYEQAQTTIQHVDFRPVSQCMLALDRLYTWNRRYGGLSDAPSTRVWAENPIELRRRVLEEANAKLQKLDLTVRSWVIEEKAIIVMRQAFVAKTMVLCGVLVVGGILAGILLGERLAGVDPFNITTFAWVLAGFIILLAKSLYVGEWPWRDFLRGRVPCRSVSELERVTGVDAQDIMEYLLAKESYTILDTKGPFNRLFMRRYDDGFSIDVKMELRTLVASGIIVVKVATHMGPALVCLDIRRGVDGRSIIPHYHSAEKDERILGCFEFPETLEKDEEIPLQELPRGMAWTRILGVYHNPQKKFR